MDFFFVCLNLLLVRFEIIRIEVIQASTKFDESDKLLDQVELELNDLHDMAIAMGRELDSHNQRLDVSIKTTKKADATIRNLDEEINILLMR